MGIRQWNLPQAADAEALEVLRRATGFSELLCRIFAARGYRDGDGAKRFISRDRMLTSPYLLKDMDKAVERVHRAIEEEERIAVFGDYDCDGITATALLTDYLRAVGADTIYYVPHRETEGYGMNRDAVGFLHEQGVRLIITVDNGISAHEEIAYAGTLGIDVVVTDHHTPRQTLPGAVAVIDPHRADCGSGLHELAGVGVAFKLAWALEGDEAGEELLEYYADLVMIGTVADVVPLTGENRAIVTQGLIQLGQTERIGLRALLDRCGIQDKQLTAEIVAFTVAPRLNAVGRMDRVDDAIELLLTDDARCAVETAELIDGFNVRRKELEDGILTEIEDRLAKNPELGQDRLLIVAGEGWHHGVVGIVASRMMERVGKPCLILSLDGDIARGSARSIPGFSIIEAITACAEHLTRFGGHPLAAGMSLPADRYGDFVRQMQEYARVRYPLMPRRSLDIDCILSPEDLVIEKISQLSELEPFGAGNPVPLFLLRDMTIDKILPTSGGKHIRMSLSGSGISVMAVYFRMSEDNFPYHPGDVVDVAAGITVQVYNDRRQLSVVIRDLRSSGIAQEDIIRDSELCACYRRGEYDALEEKEALLPTRDDIAVVYRYLRRCRGGYRHGEYELYYRIADSGVSFAKMLISLDILEELELIARKNEKGEDGLFCLSNPGKVELERSSILGRLGAYITS